MDPRRLPWWRLSRGQLTTGAQHNADWGLMLHEHTPCASALTTLLSGLLVQIHAAGLIWLSAAALPGRMQLITCCVQLGIKCCSTVQFIDTPQCIILFVWRGDADARGA